METIKIRILAIVPYTELKDQLITSVIKRPNIKLTAVIGNSTDCEEILKLYPSSEFDVILSRGGTAEHLKKVAPIPVIEIGISLYDVLCSLKNAETYAKKVAVIGNNPIGKAARQLSAIMNNEVSVHIADSLEEKAKVIAQLKEEDNDLVIGDMSSYKLALAEGMDAMLIISSEISIQETFDEVERTVNSQYYYRYQSEIYSYFFKQDWDELIAFDQELKVQYYTLPEDADNEQTFAVLREHIRAGKEFPFEIQLSSGEFWQVHGGKMTTCMGTGWALRLQKAKNTYLSPSDGVSVINKNKLLDGELNLEYYQLCGGEIRSVVESCKDIFGPILIQGEIGTGKDCVAYQLFYRSSHFTKAFYTLDCKIVSSSHWERLMERESSPFYKNNQTIYLKNLQNLGKEQADELFAFMDNTRLHRRNRMVFSTRQCNSFEEMDYATEFVKHHYSEYSLQLLALRERKECIPRMAALCINQTNAALGRRVVGFSADALNLLRDYEWPGNIAQFKRVVAGLVACSETHYIHADKLSAALMREQEQRTLEKGSSGLSINPQKTLKEIEYDIVNHILMEEDYNQVKTASRLGISRSTLWRMIRDYQKYRPQEGGR